MRGQELYSRPGHIVKTTLDVFWQLDLRVTPTQLTFSEVLV